MHHACRNSGSMRRIGSQTRVDARRDDAANMLGARKDEKSCYVDNRLALKVDTPLA